MCLIFLLVLFYVAAANSTSSFSSSSSRSAIATLHNFWHPLVKLSDNRKINQKLKTESHRYSWFLQNLTIAWTDPQQIIDIENPSSEYSKLVYRISHRSQMKVIVSLLPKLVVCMNVRLITMNIVTETPNSEEKENCNLFIKIIDQTKNLVHQSWCKLVVCVSHRTKSYEEAFK